MHITRNIIATIGVGLILLACWLVHPALCYFTAGALLLSGAVYGMVRSSRGSGK